MKLGADLPSSYDLPTDLDRKFLDLLKVRFHLSFQSQKQVSEWMADCRMWGEAEFFPFVEAARERAEELLRRGGNPRQAGEQFFAEAGEKYRELQAREKELPAGAPETPVFRVETKELKGRIFRTCPAHSDQGICCNLQVLNIIDNCPMACSYCILQSHYHDDTVKAPANLAAALSRLELDPARRYRIGPGEHSDALYLGNEGGLLDDLFTFAARHPNVILELKTKSANVAHLLARPVPANVCPSWSLNSPAVIAAEEHGSASLDERLRAARACADVGLPVGFHLHPMMFYRGWETDYRAVVEKVLATFRPDEVLWFTLGCVTYGRGLERHVRASGRPSRILQMESETTPDGKITYAAGVRERLYQNALTALAPWRGKVAIYLCMEFEPMWRAVMGYVPAMPDGLDGEINASAFAKLRSP